MFKEQENYRSESKCTVSRGISSREELSSMIGKTINVVPVYWNQQNQAMKVCVSNSFEDVITKEELSIYHLKLSSNGGFAPEIKNILFNGVISVKICLSEDGIIYLSRKENMLDAIQYFTNNMQKVIDGEFISAIESSAFFELGAGIVGSVHAREVSDCFVPSVQSYFSHTLKGDLVSLKIIGTKFDDETKFELSYKQAQKIPTFSEGDFVKGRIARYLSYNNHSGLFVEIHPLVTGILNTESIDVFYNDTDAYNSVYIHHQHVIIGHFYMFRIISVRPKSLKLELVI